MSKSKEQLVQELQEVVAGLDQIMDSYAREEANARAQGLHYREPSLHERALHVLAQTVLLMLQEP